MTSQGYVWVWRDGDDWFVGVDTPTDSLVLHERRFGCAPDEPGRAYATQRGAQGAAERIAKALGLPVRPDEE